MLSGMTPGQQLLFFALIGFVVFCIAKSAKGGKGGKGGGGGSTPPKE